MKKLLVISDTHGNRADLRLLLQKMQAADFVFHLGDGAADMLEFKDILGGKLISVSGNCDFFSPLDSQIITEIEGVKILCCHGHKYRIKFGLERLKNAAIELGLAAVFYGHTHRAAVDVIDGMHFINPGALALGQLRKSYCDIIINDSEILAEIKYLT